AVVGQPVGLAVDDVDQRPRQFQVGDGLHGGQHLVDAEGLGVGGGLACAVDGLGGPPAGLQRGDGPSGLSLDQQQGGQFVALGLFVGQLGLVGLALVAVVAEGGPVADDQPPGAGVLAAPVVGQAVQGPGQVGQADAVIVQKAVGPQDGGEARGQVGPG